MGKFKGYSLFSLKLIGLPCLMQLLLWLHISDFRTLKDDSMSIYSLTLNDCFSHLKCLPKWWQTFSQNRFWYLFLYIYFFTFEIIRFCSYSAGAACTSNTYHSVLGDFRFPISASAFAVKGVLHPRPLLWPFVHLSQDIKHIGDK